MKLHAAACITMMAGRIFAMNDDIVIDDFERPDWGAKWSVEGSAFGPGPSAGTVGDQRPVAGYSGGRLANSFHGGDAATGMATSAPFAIQRRFINFLIGGGRREGETGLELTVDGAVVRRATGTAYGGGDSEHLRAHSWDVSEFAGKQARLRLVDKATGSWGHIAVDRIVQSDHATMALFPDASTTLATNSVLGAIAWAEADPARPSYHFHPPALWLNDPNAPLFHDGWYHLFYQHNPYGDRWDHMHWGHARSRDLVTWEHLPVALAPREDKGEVGVWSGAAVKRPDGKPLLVYTSILGHTSAKDYAEQWAAEPADDDLVTWKRLATNPVMKPELHAPLKIYEWRDPFFFTANGRQFCVVAGNHVKPGGDRQGIVALYEATTPDLTAWAFRRVLFEHPDPANENIEVPGFFPLGDKWVLTITPPALNEYYIGNFDPVTLAFTPTSHGVLDTSTSFFAPNSMETPDGKRVMWGWVRGFPEDKGWNGVLTVPRLLSLAGARLRMEPLPALAKLRGSHASRPAASLSPAVQATGVAWPSQEAIVRVKLGTSESCKVRVGSTTVMVQFAEGWLSINGTRYETGPFAAGDEHTIHLLTDRSLLEVYVDYVSCTTKVTPLVADPASIEISVAEGSTGELLSLDVWALGSAMPGDAREEILRHRSPSESWTMH